MYAIMEQFTERERERALDLFVNGTTRVSLTWHTVRLVRLGLPTYVGDDGVSLSGFVREFSICPLGALGFVRWGAEALALFPEEERQRLGQTNPTVKTTLDGLLYPHPDMLARRLLDLGYERATHLIDHKLQGYERVLSLGRAAKEVERDYEASKLDRPEALYAAFGIDWPADAYVELQIDGQRCVRRFGMTSGTTATFTLAQTSGTLVSA